MLRFSSVRAAVVLGCIIVCLSALIGRVAWLQTYGRQLTLRSAERQQHQTVHLPARRGSVFDANGILMAGTVPTKTLYVDPHFFTQQFHTEPRTPAQMDAAIEKLAAVLDRDGTELKKLIEEKSEKRFVKIAEDVDEQVAEKASKLDIPGIGFVAGSERTYPMGSIAAHILGGVGKEGKGLEGIELKFERALAGHDGMERVLKDARRRPIAVVADDYVPPTHGQHLVLSVDSNIQMIAEQELEAACEKFKAKRGEVVIMNPTTGEVLALANWPTFKPQQMDETAVELRRNNCLVCPYEPGSTMKPFIAGPAMMWQLIRMDEKWPILGISWFTPYGRRVTDVHHYGPLATWDVLVKSSNIGISMIAERMGNPKVHAGLTSFGFGKATGIELPGENPGKLNPLPAWTKYSTESVAQGYEIMLTPLQLARAFCVYANGGRLVSPSLVKGVLDESGNVISRRAIVPLASNPRVVDAQTAENMKRILSDVVIRGTAKGSRSECWNIFGKTGTAHISMGRSGYSPDKFNSSFLGGAPAENPRLVIAMIVHEADRKIAHYGGTVSAPNACKALERSLAYLQVPASPDLEPPPAYIANTLVNFDPKVYTNRGIGSPVAKAE